MPLPLFSQIPPPDPVLQALERIVEKLTVMERCLWSIDAAMAGLGRDLATMASDLATVRQLRDEG